MNSPVGYSPMFKCFNEIYLFIQECQLNRDVNDQELQERLIATLRHNPHMGPRRAKDPLFIVYHYAAPVSYSLTGLIEKNKVNYPTLETT